MELRNCMSLEKLPSKMRALRRLRIEYCPKIKGLTTQFAALKELEIRDYEGVESLEQISIESLESLSVYGCKNLGSLSQCLRALSNLTELYIEECPALEIEDFPALPITLSYFYLDNCPKIKSLPSQWHHLTSLQRLHIWDCQNIKCFRKGGLPPNLQILSIVGCENLKQPVTEWGLPNLTSLESLTIDGRSMGGEGEKEWFPSEEEDAWSLLFPSSLTSLDIYNMRNLERLSSGLPNHLSSLKQLGIYDCPKLRYLPEDGLPPSLQYLEILGCKILKDGCSKLTGHYWPLIQEIPSIYIEDVRIQ
ncbi:putative disease resistance protein At3g14460 [Rhodamnia argentea]|uniref:Disease resistance protein At3g14460 n=1 Tax=Rhodamnia argentea TaxID=178133 RepID=A0A8B8PP66_9MYRT|nr:putative disease resistance protein At3g14460 [Rhodamnia argentea]